MIAGEREVKDRRRRQSLPVKVWTRRQLNPSATSFSVLHATTQAAQPVQRSRSRTKSRGHARSTSTALSWNAAPWPISVSRAAENRLIPPPSDSHQPLWMTMHPGRRL